MSADEGETRLEGEGLRRRSGRKNEDEKEPPKRKRRNRESCPRKRGVGAAVSMRVYRVVWMTIRLLAQLRYETLAQTTTKQTCHASVIGLFFLRRNSTRGPVRANFAMIDREC